MHFRVNTVKRFNTHQSACLRDLSTPVLRTPQKRKGFVTNGMQRMRGPMLVHVAGRTAVPIWRLPVGGRRVDAGGGCAGSTDAGVYQFAGGKGAKRLQELVEHRVATCAGLRSEPLPVDVCCVSNSRRKIVASGWRNANCACWDGHGRALYCSDRCDHAIGRGRGRRRCGTGRECQHIRGGRLLHTSCMPAAVPAQPTTRAPG